MRLSALDRGTPGTRVVVPGIAMIAVTYGLARYGYGLLLPEMQSDLRLGPAAAGLISSGSYVTYLIANLVVVPVSAAIGRRGCLAVGTLLATGGMALLAVAPGPAVAGVGVLVGGAAAGMSFPPYAGLVAAHVSARRRDSAWTWISSGTGWGVALAGPLAIALGEQWRAVWWVFVAVSLGVGAVAVALTPREDREQRRRPQLSPSWFFCPKSRPLLISSVLLGTGTAVWWVFAVDAMRAADVGPSAARGVYALCGAASVLASGSGVVFSRFGLRAGYLVSCVLLGVAIVLFGLGRAPVVVYAVSAVAFGVFYCATLAGGGIWSTRVFADNPMAGLAAYESAITVGTLIGPALAGLGIEHVGRSWTFLVAGAVVLVSLPFCPPTEERRRRLAAHRCTATPVRDS